MMTPNFMNDVPQEGFKPSVAWLRRASRLAHPSSSRLIGGFKWAGFTGAKARFCDCFVSGHDFTACGKSHVWKWFVSGHDFSRAEQRRKKDGALALEEPRWLCSFHVTPESPAERCATGSWRSAMTHSASA